VALLLCRCDAPLLFLELDRILRPGGHLLFRERRKDSSLITRLAASLHWELKKSFNQSGEELHVYQKTFWRPRRRANTALNDVPATDCDRYSML